MTALLELRNATKIYGRGSNTTLALDNISLAIQSNPPSIVSVVGESGSGKTTLKLLLMGFLSPTSGAVLYRGKVLEKLSNAEKLTFRRDVQAIFQDPFAVYNPFYRVDHVLEVPIKKFKLASSKDEARDLMEEALKGVGLRPEETLGRYPHQLSGGQRQRIVVARALLLKPKLLIADEPVSMVDASLRATILESLDKLNREFDISLLYITHDLATAYHISDHIVVLYRGSVMEAGDVDAVIKQPQHPYTRLLIDSIPWPDLNIKWGKDQAIIPEDRVQAKSNRGCKFAGRCPYTMDKCWQAPPPLYQLSDGRVVSCYLNEGNPVVSQESIATLFAHRAPDAVVEKPHATGEQVSG